jgi:cell shape-determining protein MreD
MAVVVGSCVIFDVVVCGDDVVVVDVVVGVAIVVGVIVDVVFGEVLGVVV